MKVSGVTVLRNAVKLGYPFAESIRSALPLCDEFIVVVGDSDDGTIDAVRGLDDSRIRVVETVWSDKIEPQRYVISQQTNIGLDNCKGDWVISLQANEVLHEGAHDNLRGLMEKYAEDKSVEALLLERLTFWGDYGHYLRVYPHRFKYSARIVKPNLEVRSIRDGMSFGVFESSSNLTRYPMAIDTGEDIFRYGYVCSTDDLAGKDAEAVHMKDNVGREYRDNYFYTAMPKQYVAEYKGAHPSVIAERKGGFEQSISMDSPDWRIELTMKERQRVFETGFYERFAVPSFRNTRYKLMGKYKKKGRR